MSAAKTARESREGLKAGMLPSGRVGPEHRAFEICGAGGFQVIARSEVLDDLFEMGREVVAYDSVPELVEVLGRYLSRTAVAEHEAIAPAGYRRAMRDHSFDVHVGSLVGMLS